MKWTTANLKNPNYTENHEIYVGTHTGSFKKLTPGNEDKPHGQTNLLDLKSLNKDAKITALAFGNDEKSEVLIGHAHNSVQLQNLQSEQIVREFEVKTSPVVGVARYEDFLIAGFADGQIQRLSITDEEDETDSLLLKAGDNMSRLRQCETQKNMIAVGGKARQNNLKIFDMAADGKQIFSSKNLPNDFLQLEVPVWDSDMAFIDESHTIATCSRHGYVRVYDTRKQRRPVQYFASDEPQLSFATIAAKGNYVYTGTTMGALKAFDIRKMKNFVHTYKGFTGGISDLYVDATGKYLASSSLDRYVRVHHTDSCVLLYQCYVKSKATCVLLRELPKEDNNDAELDLNLNGKGTEMKKKPGEKRVAHDAESADEEYEEMFDKMQTICDEDEAEDNKVEENKEKTAPKRKSKLNQSQNKRKKN